MTPEQWKDIKYFTREDITCKCGCGYDDLDYDFAMKYDAACEFSGIKPNISSGCRCKQHNKNERGSKRSRHLKGDAIDNQIYKDSEVYAFVKALFMMNLTVLTSQKMGSPMLGRFIHADGRPKPIHKSY